MPHKIHSSPFIHSNHTFRSTPQLLCWTNASCPTQSPSRQLSQNGVSSSHPCKLSRNCRSTSVLRDNFPCARERRNEWTPQRRGALRRASYAKQQLYNFISIEAAIQPVKLLAKHSRHQTPPLLSLLAALSSFLPQPGSPLPFSSRRLPSCRPAVISFFPPQTRQDACHRVPWGPGITPHSINDTDLWHPGHVAWPPKRGFEGDSGDLANGLSYLLEGGSIELPGFAGVMG